MTIRASDPKASAVENSRFWARIPNPSVARARNRPDSRMAGIAITAPTGTITSAERSRAIGYGTPADSRCDNDVAPKTTNTAWASDTWRDRPTRRLRLMNTSTKITVAVRVRSREPDRNGGSTAATATAATTGRTGKFRRTAADGRALIGRTRTEMTSRKRPLRETTSTRN